MSELARLPAKRFRRIGNIRLEQLGSSLGLNPLDADFPDTTFPKRFDRLSFRFV